MSDLFTIGATGVSAYQRALAVVSNNISNVSTDGYSRQDTTLVANSPVRLGNTYLGTGARFDSVHRQYDAFIESNLRNSQSDLNTQAPLLTYANRLIDIMGDESVGLTSALNTFFESARNVSTDPASLVQRGLFLRDADGLASRFRQLADQMDLLDSETNQAVTTDVDQVNAITAQLAFVNKQLTRHTSVDKQPAELLDQRDLLLRNLSEIVGFNTKFAANGEVLVSVGDTINQGVLVNGQKSKLLSVSESVDEPGKLNFLIDAYGDAETVSSITSGSIGGALAFRDQVLTPARGSLNDLATSVATQVNGAHTDGLDLNGRIGTDLFGFEQGVDAAVGIKVMFTDSTKVAVAGQFRVVDEPLNVGSAQATVSYTAPEFTGPLPLNQALESGISPDYVTTVSTSGSVQAAAIASIPQGMQDAVIYLDNAQSGQALQVFTRDGRHLAGTYLDASQTSVMVGDSFGMEAGATYTNGYLNAPGGHAYLGMDIFVGAKADVQQIQQFDTLTGAVLPPLPVAAELRATYVTNATGPIAAGAFTLNGVELPALSQSGPLGASDVATWLNGASSQTGVTANVDSATGGLVLANAVSNTTGDIRLGMGSASPEELKNLGFRTAAYISGSAQDDLIVSVSAFGSSAASAQVMATYGPTAESPKQLLRDRVLQVTFIDTVSYEISDKATGDVMASRAFDPTNPAETIRFRGLSLQLSGTPQAGDVFTIDGNRDGIGNNEAMLKVVGLETDTSFMGGGLTMTETYIERVNEVGSVARQASISKDALTVVYQQAQESRDGVSGVSLDQEAADLVRFQQAYQANAKVMQTASTLFDSILQLR